MFNELTNERMSAYPLYDVPWLVREANDSYMSASRRRIRQFNQAVVDDYFILRDRGVSAEDALETVAKKHLITVKRVRKILKWFYQEAKKRKKYDFLEKFSPLREQITDF